MPLPSNDRFQKFREGHFCTWQNPRGPDQNFVKYVIILVHDRLDALVGESVNELLQCHLLHTPAYLTNAAH